jgi:hypothetical protein
MRMKLLCVLLLGGLCSPAAPAQEDKRDPAKLLAPFVNDTTIAAIEIDVQKVDFDAVFQYLAQPKLPPGARDELAKEQEHARQQRAAFLRAGGRYVYVLFNLPENIPHGPQPLLVIPADKAEVRQALQVYVAQFPFFKSEIKGDLLLVSTPPVLQALSRFQAKEVPQLAPAFTAVTAFPQRAAVRLPDTLRRSLEELAPDLPRELGGGSIKTFTRGLKWVAVGGDVSEKMQFRVQGQAENAQSARDLAALARQALELILKESRMPASFVDVLSPKADGDRLELALDTRTINATIVPAIVKVRESAGKAQSTNNLRQIALAFHNYHDVYKAFPPQANQDKQKKLLLSWRVHILPFIEENVLYQEFKLNEPWDSPHNKKLIARMPKFYRSPLSRPDLEEGKTTYVLPVGPKLLFNGAKRPKIQQITDGTSNTILALDADDSQAVIWTQPADWRVDPMSPKKGAVRAGLGILAAFCDGSVHVLPGTVDAEQIWALLTPTGGEVIDWKKITGR